MGKLRSMVATSVAVLATSVMAVSLAPTVGAAPVVPATVNNAIKSCLVNGHYSGHIYSEFAIATSKVYTLDCGSPDLGYGVLHIDVGHPIPLNLTGEFYTCFARLIGEGQTSVGNTKGTTHWYWPSIENPKVEGYTQDSSREVNTMFTKSGGSNDWANCAK